MFLFKEAVLRIAPEPADPGHLTADQLERYLRLVTPLELLGSTEEHLLACETCQERVRKLDEYFSVMREALVHILAGKAVYMGTENAYDGWKVIKWR
jgi:hypothetical protein